MSINEENKNETIQSDNDTIKIYNNIQSSLKFYNFEGMSKEKIIEKYEETLCQREKHVKDLSYEIGVINEKLFNLYDKIRILEENNLTLNNKVLKMNTQYKQDSTDKEILFIKCNNLQSENDLLRNKLQSSGVDINSVLGKEKKSFFGGLFQSNAKSVKNQQNIEDTYHESKSMFSNSSKSNKDVAITLSANDLNKITLTPDTKAASSNSIQGSCKSVESVKGNTPNGGDSKSQKPSSIGSISRSSLQNPKKRGLATDNVEYEPMFK